MRRRSMSFLAATALGAATIATASPVVAQDSGTVTATLTVADHAPCLTVTATAVTYLNELAFSRAGLPVVAKADPVYSVENCGNVDVNLLVRGSLAESANAGVATWTPTDDFSVVDTCSATDVYVVDVEGQAQGAPQTTGIFEFLTLDDQLGATLVPSGAIDVDHDLFMPCVGSAGAGETMTFDIFYTAVAAENLVINEIMNNPLDVTDTSGEWFELYNPNSTAVDVNGWEISSGAESHVITNGGPLWIAPGGYLTLANNGDPATNGGFTHDYVYGGVITLGNAADSLVITHSSGYEVDRVDYDGGTTFPDPDGFTMSLEDPALDNNVGANWCTAVSNTPGSANDCP